MLSTRPRRKRVRRPPSLTRNAQTYFTQQVANITPGSSVEVEITYVQILKYADGELEFSFPMVVGPRFLGNAKDPAKIDPPRAERVGTNIGITIDLHAGGSVRGLHSVLHEIDQTPLPNGGMRVKLRKDDEIPNKDFVLRYSPAGATVETAFLTHTDKRGGFFSLVVLPPKRPTESQISSREMLFVMDQSGSQSGFPIEKSKELTYSLIHSLRPGDTFNVAGFNNTVRWLWTAPRSPSAANIEEAREFVRVMRANGGTQLREGVISALSAPPDPRRLRIVMFNTDGYVGDEKAVLQEIKLRRDTARMFTFGIGNSVNRYLLDSMAVEGRGDVEYVTLAESADAAARRFAKRMATPVLTNVTAKFDNLRASSAGPEVTELQPTQLPDVFLDRPLVIRGRFQGTGMGMVTLQGTMGGKPWSKSVGLNFRANNAPAIPVLWARAKVGELDRQNYAAQLDRSPVDVQSQITKLGLDFRIMTEYTSFVAVETRVSNVGGKQVTVPVPVAQADGVGERRMMSTGRAVFASPKSANAVQTLGSISLILSNGRGNNNVAVELVTTHATVDKNGAPAIQVRWRPDLFFRGNQTVQWLIFRDDVGTVTPIGAADGKADTFVDTTADRKFDYYSNNEKIENLVVEGLKTSTTEQKGLTPGRPHTYYVASIYKVSRTDLPPGGTVRAGNENSTEAYFRSMHQAATGLATVFDGPILVSPLPKAKLTAFGDFEFTSVAKALFPIRMGYVLQLCAKPDFTGKVYTSPEKVVIGTKNHSIPFSARFPGDTFKLYLSDALGQKQNGSAVYWRIGARNVDDNPGPAPDPSTGLRYVFSKVSSFVGP